MLSENQNEGNIEMTLPKSTPTEFCKAFIQRELESYQGDQPIWMSYWPILERMIESTEELKRPFSELIDRFGYADKFEGYPPENSYIWLILEHIWFSADFSKNDVMKARSDFKELNELGEDIVELASELASKLRKRAELFETSGFSKPEYLFIDGLFDMASEGNYLYESHVSEKLKSLTYQYDLQYWPCLADLVSAIGQFEEAQPYPTHCQFPEHVINGRQSNFKDYVIAFDEKFDEINGLPTDFRFSNEAMADIINVVLDLPDTKIATGEAIRVIRNRFSNKAR